MMGFESQGCNKLEQFGLDQLNRPGLISTARPLRNHCLQLRRADPEACGFETTYLGDNGGAAFTMSMQIQ